jgi:hypothetical protein
MSIRGGLDQSLDTRKASTESIIELEKSLILAFSRTNERLIQASRI